MKKPGRPKAGTVRLNAWVTPATDAFIRGMVSCLNPKRSTIGRVVDELAAGAQKRKKPKK